MTLSEKESARNYKAFIWHGLFLALASNFTEVNTVIPSMLIKIGANSVHLGILTAIMFGGASFMQLFFSRMLASQSYKKKWLLLGINIRVLALAGIASLFLFYVRLTPAVIFILVYLLITLFSFSGSFANVSYIDILGKTINDRRRKHFFSLKQLFTSAGFLISALLARQVLKHTSYPQNYSYLFFIAATLLFIASFGFYAIMEKTPSGLKDKGGSFVKSMKREVKANANMRNYLLIINTLGIGVSLIPFIILLVKESSGLTFDKIGNFIVYQTIGMLAGSLTLYFMAKKFRYKSVLTFDVILGVSIPLIALFLRSRPEIFQYIFVLTGIFTSTYKVSVNGMLIEISTNENRTLYAGMAGAGNILPMIFPVIAGVFIKFAGYFTAFTATALVMALSILAISKLKCK
jgi:MFS family permease